MAKLAKSSVEYGPGKPRARCSLCEHFEPPSACEIVAGTIRSGDWCDRFKAHGKEAAGKPAVVIVIGHHPSGGDDRPY